MNVHYDSTGRPIRVGDRVRWRGREYTIKAFLDTKAMNGVHHVEFNEPRHLDEQPDEFSIDLAGST